MPKSQVAPEPVSIFALDRKQSFAGTPIEVWQTMLDMFADIDAFNQLVEKRRLEKDDADTAKVKKELMEELQEVADELNRKYPFARYKKQRPKLGNPLAELSARTDLWNEAHYYLGYAQSEEEIQYKTALFKFWRQHLDSDYSPYLWDQRIQPPKEVSVLVHHVYDEIWAFTQHLKAYELVPSQEQDRQKLERWIADKVKQLLIDEEHAAIRVSKAWGVFNPVSAEDLEQAKINVEARIAKGDWQPPGLPKFKFNGI